MSIVEEKDTNKPVPRAQFLAHKDILRDVMLRHMISPEDFFGPRRFVYFVVARKEGARLLRARGFSVSRIAHVLNRDRRTVHHYLDKKTRDSKILRHVSKRGCVVKIRPQYAVKLHELAKLTDASIEAFVNQCVSDALEAA